MNQYMVKFIWNAVYWGQHVCSRMIYHAQLWPHDNHENTNCDAGVNELLTTTDELWCIFYMTMEYQDTTLPMTVVFTILILLLYTNVLTGIPWLVIVLICIACTTCPIVRRWCFFCEIHEAINICFIHIVIRIYYNTTQTFQWKNIQDIKYPD